MRHCPRLPWWTSSRESHSFRRSRGSAGTLVRTAGMSPGRTTRRGAAITMTERNPQLAPLAPVMANTPANPRGGRRLMAILGPRTSDRGKHHWKDRVMIYKWISDSSSNEVRKHVRRQWILTYTCAHSMDVPDHRAVARRHDQSWKTEQLTVFERKGDTRASCHWSRRCLLLSVYLDVCETHIQVCKKESAGNKELMNCWLS